MLPSLLRAKLSPPRLPRHVLQRPALAARLSEACDYRLTIVQAGTGYGKSTALAMLTQQAGAWFWYSADESDSDPQRFLSYLIGAFATRLPNLADAPAARLQELGAQRSNAWTQVIDALIDALPAALPQTALLLVDDFNLIDGSPEVLALFERFVTWLPEALHVIIATRHPPAMPQLLRWRARGEVSEIGREALAFQPAEIDHLFRDTYGMNLPAANLNLLCEKTEGWPIALQMVWQGLRASRRGEPVNLLERLPQSLTALFDYLAREVLDRQPRTVADFMRATSVLRELTPEACNAVAGIGDSEQVLARLHEMDFFIISLGAQHYRYHYLLHDFLRAQAAQTPERMREWHRRAAAYFAGQQNDDEAIFHGLASGEFDEAARAMSAAADGALRAGRIDTLAAWIDGLPPATLAEQPALQASLGDIYRLRSRFDQALAWYQAAEQTWRARADKAGISRALRGQALIYLDTVRPAQAESLLEEALYLTDGTADREARARMLELTAENKLNMGKPSEAEALRRESRALREEGPSEDELSVRVKLRTGQLQEAQRILETLLAAERAGSGRGETHAPRSHRETVLLLALLHAFRGQAADAFAMAREGIVLGERMQSPFVTTVGHIRLGHAWQLADAPALPSAADERAQQAVTCYQTAINMGDQLAVRRTRAEAMWGLTRAYGFFGNLSAAQSAAAEGVEISQWAGDRWLAALIEVTLGASLVLAGKPSESLETLTRALHAFRECGDHFGRAVARLWLSAAYHALRQMDRLLPCVEDLLALCETHGYGFLFAGPSLLGPPDAKLLLPVLLAARAQHCRAAYVTQLLADAGLPGIAAHPGYQLRVQTLGAFRVWRGRSEVGARAWQRDKARQLLQLLITRRMHWLQREEILDALWRDETADAAGRNFKAALNALNKAIEPEREPDAPFAYVVREGTAYRLRPEADLWLDCAQFEHAATAGLKAEGSEAVSQLRAALALYQGDYLPDARYADWTNAERERLLSWYLRGADRLAGLLHDLEQYDECLEVCQAILVRDSCWEQAYRWQMSVSAAKGNRAQALRAYRRCISTLREQLDVAPSRATIALAERMGLRV